MIKVGIVLIILQVLALIISFITGSNPFEGRTFANILGYLAIGIVGLILVIIGCSRKHKNEDNSHENDDNDDDINKQS